MGIPIYQMAVANPPIIRYRMSRGSMSLNGAMPVAKKINWNPVTGWIIVRFAQEAPSHRSIGRLMDIAYPQRPSGKRPREAD